MLVRQQKPTSAKPKPSCGGNPPGYLSLASVSAVVFPKSAKPPVRNVTLKEQTDSYPPPLNLVHSMEQLNPPLFLRNSAMK